MSMKSYEARKYVLFGKKKKVVKLPGKKEEK